MATRGDDCGSAHRVRPVRPVPGSHRGTLDESTSAWPRPTRARSGSPNVVLLVLDDVGYGQLSRVRRPVPDTHVGTAGRQRTALHQLPDHGAVLADSGLLLTGRNHHTLGLSSITELSIGYPAHNGYMGFEHGFLSEMLLEHGYNTFAVGKWHLTPPRGDDDRRAVPPLAAGPRIRALLRLPRRRHRPVAPRPHPRQPPCRARPTRPRTATTSTRPGRPRHRVHQGRPRQAPPTNRSSSTTPPARRTPRTTWSRSGPSSTGASSTWAGTATARCVFARQIETGHRPRRDACCPSATRTCRPGTRSAERAADVRPPDGGVRRLPRRRPTTTSAACVDFIEQTRRARQHARRGHLRQRRQRRGRPHGTFNETLFFNCVHERSRTTWPTSTTGVASTRSPTMRGAGPGRAPRRSGAGSARRTGAGSATRASCPGRRASTPAARYAPVRPCDRPRADRARRARVEAPATVRGVPQSDPRVELRPHVRRRRGVEPARHAVLRDVRAPLALPRGLEGRLPLARARASRRASEHGRISGMPLTGEILDGSTPTSGSSTT